MLSHLNDSNLGMATLKGFCTCILNAWEKNTNKTHPNIPSQTAEEEIHILAVLKAEYSCMSLIYVSMSPTLKHLFGQLHQLGKFPRISAREQRDVIFQQAKGTYSYANGSHFP